MVYGANGKDIIIVASANGLSIDAKAGDDVLYSTTANNSLMGGQGSDTFVIDWNNAAGIEIQDLANGSDSNVIKLTNASAADITATLTAEGALCLSNGLGETMTIRDWSNSTYDSIKLLSAEGCISYSSSALSNALGQLETAEISFADTALAGMAEHLTLTTEDEEQLIKITAYSK